MFSVIVRKLPTNRFSRNAKLYLLSAIPDGLGFGIYGLLFNLYILSTGASPDFLGLVTAALSLTGLVFAFPAAALSDRLGRKATLLLSGLVAPLALMVLGLASDMKLLFVSTLTFGLAGSLWDVSLAPFKAENTTAENRTAFFSITATIFTLGALVGNLVGGYLPGLFASWLGVGAESVMAYRMSLMTVVILWILSCLPLFFLEPVGGSGTVPVERLRLNITFATLPFYTKLVARELAAAFGTALLVPFLNVFFKEIHAVSDRQLGSLFATSNLLIAFGTLAAPWLVRRVGKVQSVALAQLLAIPFLLALGFGPLSWAAVGFLVRGMLMNMMSPVFTTFVMESVEPTERATANSVMITTWNLAWVIGTYLSGLVQSRYGFTPLFIAVMILYAVAAGLTLYFFAPREEEKETDLDMEMLPA